MRPKLAKKVRLKWDARENKMMLLYPERGLLLNETAAEIAKLCDGSKTVEEIARTFVSRGDVHEIAKEVQEFVSELQKRNLLE